MISIRLRHQSDCAEGSGRHFYRVAGVNLSADMPIGYLRAFQSVPGGSHRSTAEEEFPESFEEVDTVFSGTGWIGQAWRHVLCTRSPQGYHVNISDIGRFFVQTSGKCITLVYQAPGCPSVLVEEALLGPPLILALARHGVWSVHASAIAASDHALLFTGPSGYGKSTLAEFLAKSLPNSFDRIADDLVPVCIESGVLYAHTRYPQLKIGPDYQAGTLQPERLPVATVYDLCKLEDDELRLEWISEQASAISFARHTVSSRLFDVELLENHLDFCTTAARSVRTSRLCYPRRFAALEAVGELISSNVLTLLGGHDPADN